MEHVAMYLFVLLDHFERFEDRGKAENSLATLAINRLRSRG
ncbi:hypothetical protein BN903_15 [Halorubrum sp. AJ67]|nr:hypothetical protein BN903_15 [Halorubrum sp. AJ67]